MMIYADYAATAPLRESAKAVLQESLDWYGNPSSSHIAGIEASKKIEQAREIIASCINAEPEEIIFTSGGTESNNLAIKGIIKKLPRRKKWSFISPIEHHSVLEPASDLTVLKEMMTADERGIVNIPEDSLFLDDFGFLTLMFANNETGVIQPIADFGNFCKDHGIIFHSDATAAVGHIPIGVKALKIDLLTASGHKFGGPQGVGFLYKRKGIELAPEIVGGGQEYGYRSGTQPVALIMAMAAALKEAIDNIDKEIEYVKKVRNCFEAVIKTAFPESKIISENEDRLPGMSEIIFPGMENDVAVLRMAENGLCASSGAACSTGSMEPSHVLTAMNIPESEARSAVRFSFGNFSTEKNIENSVKIIKNIYSEIL